MSTHKEQYDSENMPEDEDEGESTPEEGASEDEYAYFRPRPGPQVWLIIAVAAIIVGIAVLFVYQTGDTKTILSKKPILPVATASVLPPGTGQNCPGGGGCLGTPAAAAPPSGFAQNCPNGGGCLGTPAAAASPPGLGQNCPGGGNCFGAPARVGSSAGILPAAASALTGAAQPAVCPRCGNQAIPLCHHCNSIMQPLGNGLYSCPRCGTVGTVPCPYCNARMESNPPQSAAVATPATVAVRTNSLGGGGTNVPAGGRTGGQFICPNCSTTGLPNWTPTGLLGCPNCGGGMSTTTAVAP